MVVGRNDQPIMNLYKRNSFILS